MAAGACSAALGTSLASAGLGSSVVAGAGAAGSVDLAASEASAGAVARGEKCQKLKGEKRTAQSSLDDLPAAGADSAGWVASAAAAAAAGAAASVLVGWAPSAGLLGLAAVFSSLLLKMALNLAFKLLRALGAISRVGRGWCG